MITPQKSTAPVRLRRFRRGSARPRKDVVAVEEPLEIRLTHVGDGGPATESVSVTMRTPGDDFELSAGFLFTEGILERPEDVAGLSYCRGDEPQEYNIVEVRLKSDVSLDPALLTRNFYTTSSCGVCGKASLEAVELQGCAPLPDGTWTVDAEVLVGMPQALRTGQRVFSRTGGIHAAGLFDPRGELLVLREDVGRHNAVDKVIGREFLASRLPLGDRVLVVSGRTSFEIMQKALAAGIPTVVAVGAPSSLAVDLAARFNMTLVGFASRGGFNVYTGHGRISGGLD